MRETDFPQDCISFVWDSDSQSHARSRTREDPISPSEVPDVQQWDSFPHLHPERHREQIGPSSPPVLLEVGLNTVFGPNPAVPELGQCKPGCGLLLQLWKTLGWCKKDEGWWDTTVYAKGSPVNKLIDVLVPIFLYFSKVIESSDLSI